MGTLAMMVEVQEALKRKLQAVKADFDPQDVRAYLAMVVEPHLRAVQIARLSLVLRSRTGHVIVAELTDGYLGDHTPYIRLIETLDMLRCTFFTLHTEDGIVSSYSENEWDWVVLKYEKTASPFMDPLIEVFWPPFFDFA